ncbi:MAG: hypothetical protein WA962_14730 [Ornithinimicrobium sp.]
MPTPPLDPHREGRLPAVALGAGLAVACGCLAIALLTWSVHGAVATGGAPIPVADGILLLIAGVAGVVTAALATLVGLGVVALLTPSPSGDPAGMVRIAPALAARVATLLLLLTVTSPTAQADVIVAHGPQATGVAISDSVVHPGVPMAARENGESEHDTKQNDTNQNGTAGDSRSIGAMSAPLPDWQSTRAPSSLAKDAAPARPSPGSSAPGATPPLQAESSAGVVIMRGDTLWGIAAADLPPGASNAEIAAHWPRWYEANRLVIGPNPDLILPGHILHPPTPSGEQP